MHVALKVSSMVPDSRWSCVAETFCFARTKLLLEWDASPVNDMLADSIVALAAQAQTR